VCARACNRAVPALAHTFDPIGKEWDSMIRATFAVPSLLEATVSDPRIAQRLAGFVSRTLPIRDGITEHLHAVRRRCPRLFLLSDAELLHLTLGGKSLSTSSRLLTKCFPSVEMLHGVPRTADISSGGHSGKHHDVTGCYALRSSLGIDLTPEAYMSDSMQPPEIASLKNWDGEYVEFQATCWSATHHAAHRFFKLAQVITARGGPEFWVRKVR